MSRQEILELLKQTIDETFASTPPASSLIGETTDLLVDIPMFMVEDLDEFLTALEEKLGVGWGELVGADLLGEVDHFTKVENIINEVESYLDFLNDEDIIFSDILPGEKIINISSSEFESGATENFYSFKTDNFNNLISPLKKEIDVDFNEKSKRMMQNCAQANAHAANLLQAFLGFNYFGKSIDEKDLLYPVKELLVCMHKLLAEYDLENDEFFKNSSPGFFLEFDNPVTVKYLHELEAASQMLSVVVAKLLEKILNDVQELDKGWKETETEFKEIAEDVNMVFSICNDIITYANSDINTLLKKH